MDNSYERYEEPRVRIAASTGMLWQADLVEAINILAKLGYDGVDLSPHHLLATANDLEVQAAAQQLMNYGLPCVTLTTDVEGFATQSDAQNETQIGRFARYLDIAQQLNCYLLQVQPGAPLHGGPMREDHWLRAAHYLRECCDLALGEGCEVLVPTGPGLTQTVDGTLYLIDLVNRPNLGVKYNPGAIAATEQRYGVEALARLGGLIFVVETTDVLLKPEKTPRATLLGEGDIDYQGIVRQLVRSGYDGYITTACAVPGGSTAIASPALGDDEWADKPPADGALDDMIPAERPSAIAIETARHELAALRQLLDETF
ncbi:MAG: sugar phosphate isomerase/epimerase family protein [Armatimonadota bacterium]